MLLICQVSQGVADALREQQLSYLPSKRLLFHFRLRGKCQGCYWANTQQAEVNRKWKQQKIAFSIVIQWFLCSPLKINTGDKKQEKPCSRGCSLTAEIKQHSLPHMEGNQILKHDDNKRLYNIVIMLNRIYSFWSTCSLNQSVVFHSTVLMVH